MKFLGRTWWWTCEIIKSRVCVCSIVHLLGAVHEVCMESSAKKSTTVCMSLQQRNSSAGSTGQVLWLPVSVQVLWLPVSVRIGSMTTSECLYKFYDYQWVSVWNSMTTSECLYIFCDYRWVYVCAMHTAHWLRIAYCYHTYISLSVCPCALHPTLSDIQLTNLEQ